ncbi:MAG TPA: hypothetical protein VIH91_02345, partial [Terriglobales bacterium]
PGSDKPESALQKPNLRVRCQVLRGIAHPATSSALQKTRHLRHGLLSQRSGIILEYWIGQERAFLAGPPRVVRH